MMQVDDLVHLNAALNAVTIVLLALGLYFIRRGEPMRHRAVMLSAAAVSARRDLRRRSLTVLNRRAVACRTATASG